MSSLIGKRIGGQTYYYLREVARVGGRPKIVSQRYLGKAGDIAAAMDGVTVLPERTRHLAFGDVAAAWSVIERLRGAQVIDEVDRSRRGRGGAPGRGATAPWPADTERGARAGAAGGGARGAG